MKSAYVRLVTVTFFLLNVSFYCVGQIAPGGSVRSLYVSNGNTTAITFHAAIRAVDIGSSDLLAQKMNDTILKVKAAVKDMAATNLNVVTSDGQLHCFSVLYDSTVKGLPVNVAAERPAPSVAAAAVSEPNQMDVQRLAAAICLKKTFLPGPRTGVEHVNLRLAGLYFDRGILYVQLSLRNRSALPYKIDFVRSAIMDRTTRKRTTRQETELKPVYTTVPDTALPAGQNLSLVLAYPQFSITRKKKVEVQLFEASGGRHIKLVLKSRHLLKFRSTTGIASVQQHL